MQLWWQLNSGAADKRFGCNSKFWWRPKISIANIFRVSFPISLELKQTLNANSNEFLYCKWVSDIGKSKKNLSFPNLQQNWFADINPYSILIYV